MVHKYKCTAHLQYKTVFNWNISNTELFGVGHFSLKVQNLRTHMQALVQRICLSNDNNFPWTIEMVNKYECTAHLQHKTLSGSFSLKVQARVFFPVQALKSAWGISKLICYVKPTACFWGCYFRCQLCAIQLEEEFLEELKCIPQFLGICKSHCICRPNEHCASCCKVPQCSQHCDAI